MRDNGTLSHHAALIYTMVIMSAADREMPDVELAEMGDMVGHLPVFRDYDKNSITKTANACVELLKSEDGLNKILANIKAGLPAHLRETAYALACDVAAADGKVTQEEARVLEMLRFELDLGKLVCAALERGARARHMKL